MTCFVHRHAFSCGWPGLPRLLGHPGCLTAWLAGWQLSQRHALPAACHISCCCSCCCCCRGDKSACLCHSYAPQISQPRVPQTLRVPKIHWHLALSLSLSALAAHIQLENSTRCHARTLTLSHAQLWAIKSFFGFLDLRQILWHLATLIARTAATIFTYNLCVRRNFKQFNADINLAKRNTLSSQLPSAGHCARHNRRCCCCCFYS